MGRPIEILSNNREVSSRAGRARRLERTDKKIFLRTTIFAFSAYCLLALRCLLPTAYWLYELVENFAADGNFIEQVGSRRDAQAVVVAQGSADAAVAARVSLKRVDG